MKKTILIILILFILIGCNNNDYIEDSDEELLFNLLNINKKFEVHSLNNDLNNFILYDPMNKKVIPVNRYCNNDFDCVNYMEEEYSCFNKKYTEFDMEFKSSLERYKNLNLTLKNNCLCIKNECQFNGQPYTWLKQNIEEDAKIMMFWDYGKFFNNIGLNSIISHRSKRMNEYFEEIQTLFKDFDIEREWGSDEKIHDVLVFFMSEDLNKSIDVLRKYDVDYIYVDYYTYNLRSTLKYLYDKYKNDNLHLDSHSYFDYNYENTTLEKLYSYDGENINSVEILYKFYRHNSSNLKTSLFEVKLNED
ncbi:MAG: hypothetical protein ACMXX8_00535 [Candidatus Woesearchaeota archaeon]